jgi:tetratricopeptide (TPR) repeat protein
MVLVATGQVPSRAEDDWVGQRVVPKEREFVLHLDDELVEPSRKAIAIYRVERADGPTLWLQAEGRRLSGSARAEDVIPVERAIAYFTERLRAHPTDAWAYAMRGFVREDRNELGAALRDDDEAIRLESTLSALYFRRARVRLAMQEPDRAIDDFNAAIRLDPRCALAYSGRGTAWGLKRDFDKAIADHSEAIFLDPLCIPAYVARGRDWQEQKEYQKAIVDYNTVIRLDPENAAVYSRRGLAWGALRAYSKAIADLELAVKLGCTEPHTDERLAWIRATCPVEKLRDGPKAVAAAVRACERMAWKDPACLSTLAAAHAETGDFVSAVKWQAEATRLATKAKDQAEGEARLALYRMKMPYRDNSP